MKPLEKVHDTPIKTWHFKPVLITHQSHCGEREAIFQMVHQDTQNSLKSSNMYTVSQSRSTMTSTLGNLPSSRARREHAPVKRLGALRTNAGQHGTGDYDDISPASIDVRELRLVPKRKAGDMCRHVTNPPLHEHGDGRTPPKQARVRFLVDDQDVPIVTESASTLIIAEQSVYDALWFEGNSKRQACLDAQAIRQAASAVQSVEQNTAEDQAKDTTDIPKTYSHLEAASYLQSMKDLLQETYGPNFGAPKSTSSVTSVSSKAQEGSSSTSRSRTIPQILEDPCAARGLEPILFPPLVEERKKVRRIVLNAQTKLPKNATPAQQAALLAAVATRVSRPSRKMAFLLGASDACTYI